MMKNSNQLFQQWGRSLIVLAFLSCIVSSLPGQTATTDTLVCGDTLVASFAPFSGQAATDTFYVWLGNCQSRVRFDFTTAAVPDGADIYYLDIQGNRTPAGSMPYFGSNCTGGNFFTDPLQYPIYSTLSPQACLPGFVELYGQGVPFQDSILQRTQLPADFKLGGMYQEGARLHLDIPSGVVAVLFVVKFNPTQSTVLSALWDCTPNCCVEARGDTVCVGDSIQLTSETEALRYTWTGPNGFSSTDPHPRFLATSGTGGWYVLRGSFRFGCEGTDSVYVQVHEPQVQVQPQQAEICQGESLTLLASGTPQFQWQSLNGAALQPQGTQALVAPLDSGAYAVIGTDLHGCSDTAWAHVYTTHLDFTLVGTDPTCSQLANGQLKGMVSSGRAPYEIRLLGQVWQGGTDMIGLPEGSYTVEMRDANGCQNQSLLTLLDPPPVMAAIGTQDPHCVGACDGELSIVPLEGLAPFRYFLNGGETDSLPTGLCAGTYQVEIWDRNGCPWQAQTELLEAEPFEIDLGRDRKIREGDSLEIELRFNQPLEAVWWDALCDSACTTRLLVKPDSLLKVKVEALSEEGCTAKDSMWVSVKKKAKCNDGVFAPTAFSPNGDGINDWFTVYADADDSDVARVGRLLIFNQWGNVVFDRSGFPPNVADFGWDGYAKGKALREGVYTWAGTFIREDGLDFDCGGSIVLLR